MLQKISGLKGDKVNGKFITIRNNNLYVSPVIVYTSNDAMNSRPSIGRENQGCGETYWKTSSLARKRTKK
jgi:hypothetical protein